MADNQPLVSVGIPTFNRPKNLRNALKYICQQTYANLEIIVSDNASPDEETQSVVKEFMANDRRIKYFRQPSNLGPIANFQFVLDAAKGEYFMWMADDDWREPSFVEVLLHELMMDDKAVMAFCDLVVLDENLDRKKDFHPTYFPFFQKIASNTTWVRLTSFFLQNETLGKGNLVFSLVRRSALADIGLVSFLKKHGFYGLDNLIVFFLLGKGRLKLVDAVLCGSTAGNVKHYPMADRWPQKMLALWKYLWGYPVLAKGFTKLCLVALFPIKLCSFYWSIGKRKWQTQSI